MINAIELTTKEIEEFLFLFATQRPIFIWGSPGIGKSSLIENFAKSVDMECVPLLGSQLAAEDLIGIPKIEGNVSKFFTPSLIYREVPFVLFIDELNIASPEIQKAFYSLILDQRIGEYKLPKGSIVIGAGNRAQDSSLVKPMTSALVNRLVHIQMKVSAKEWLNWAEQNNIHQWVIDYIRQRPNQLYTSVVPSKEESFSTPRIWEYVSDGLHAFGENPKDFLLDALFFGTLTKEHAINFKSYIKQIKNKFNIHKLLKGEESWPEKLEDRDVLFFLVDSFKQLLLKELPEKNDKLNNDIKKLVLNAKSAIKDLCRISNEMAQKVILESETGQKLPSWFLLEITKELPRLLSENKDLKK